MPAEATVTVDLRKIAENTRRIVDRLPGVGIVGVTKVTCGSPEIARAMLAGGAIALGESRLENVARLQAAGISAPVWLLRAPTPAQAPEVVATTAVSVISELATLEALDAAAAVTGSTYSVLLMVDVGDLREGMMRDEVPAFLERAERFEHIRIMGVGTSLTCHGAIVPDEHNLSQLVGVSGAAARRLGRKLTVSGGSSTSLDPMIRGVEQGRIDNLRIGEAIMLGVDPATREPIRGLDLYTDAVTVSAPVIECKVKPSKPIGTSAQDAFGGTPDFEDRGLRRRAICAMGRQDAPPEGLRPLDPRVRVLGASSDHLVLDVDDLPTPPAIGSSIEFRPGYSATLALFTSEYVRKVWVRGE
jgi:ornithine racemase